MGFTASCLASLRALWLHSTGDVGAVQPPQTTCRSQSSIARENKYPCLPQKAEPLPAVHQELLGQLWEQVDRQKSHCGTVLVPMPATSRGLSEPWVKADTRQGEGTRGRAPQVWWSAACVTPHVKPMRSWQQLVLISHFTSRMKISSQEGWSP